jgi:superfamily II DNA or RNA helicase
MRSRSKSQAKPADGPFARRTQSSFDRFVRDRGDAYFADGVVTITKISRSAVHAHVRGTRRYNAVLAIDGASVAMDCDCPHFAQEGRYCKHLWAAIRAADQADWRAALDLPAKRAPKQAAEAAQILATVDAIRAGVTPPRTSRWRHLVAPLATAPGPEARPVVEGTLGYTIALGATRVAGAPVVSLVLRGAYASKRDVRLSPERALATMDLEPLDREILATIGAVRAEVTHESIQSRASQFIVEKPGWSSLFAKLARTSRCVVLLDGGARAPFAWDEGEPWRLALAATERNDGLTVRGALVRGDERAPIEAPTLLLRQGLVFWEGRAAPLDPAGFDLVSVFRAGEVLHVPPDDIDDFVAIVSGASVACDLPESRRLTRIDVVPRMLLRVRADDPSPSDRSAARLVAEARCLYEGIAACLGDGGRVVVDKAGRRVFPRDFAREAEASSLLDELGLRPTKVGAPPGELVLAAAKLPSVVARLTAKGWSVEAEGKIYRSATATQASLASGIDWFDLELGVTFDGTKVALPRLLAALKKASPMIVLDDGTIGILPEEWLRRWGPVVGLGDVRDDVITFQRAQAGLLDALIAELPEITYDDAFAKLRATLRDFDRITPHEPPRGFRGSLRDYQKIGLGWFAHLDDLGFGGCLADDMGLGKTVQVLALLAKRARQTPRAGPSLVVAPRSVLWNWREEARRFAPKLRVLDHTGSARLAPGRHFADYDLILTTYGTLRSDAFDLEQVAFDYAILDEAQAIKNALSETAHAARRLRARRRLALTGTPVENHVGELWSLFDFLNPGMLGGGRSHAWAATRTLDAAARATIARAIRPFLLRRLKSQVAAELPDRVEQTIHCELGPEQRAHYNELRDHFRAALLPQLREEGIGQATPHVLEAILRLRQAACHPGLIDPARAGDPSAKLDLLIDQLASVRDEGHKALVFSQFTSLLALLRARLDERGIAYEYLDGKTRDRQARIARFQGDPACGLFLISLKAGGVGLNLTAAEYVYLLDPWWNPAAEAQAIDRAHRIGQTRTVFAYRLIARATIEEKVETLQRSKRDLVQSLLGDAEEASKGGRTLADLTIDDIESLFT